MRSQIDDEDPPESIFAIKGCTEPPMLTASECVSSKLSRQTRINRSLPEHLPTLISQHSCGTRMLTSAPPLTSVFLSKGLDTPDV